MAGQKKVFFHVGLGKTASTYLQYAFFPRLKGIKYIQRTSFRQYPTLIERSGAAVILVSNEFDRQLEKEAARISQHYADAGIIIVLRRQDQWIASQYRRFIKNGCAFSFKEFIDLEDNTGFWKLKELQFMPKLLYLEKLFGRKPLVLLHQDLRENSFAFFDRIALFIGAEYDRDSISLEPKHRSYSEKQLKVIRSFHLYTAEPKRHPNSIMHFFKRKWRQLICYSILYPAAILPQAWVSDDPLIDPNELQKVRDFYAEDWKACIEYADDSIETPLS